MIDVRVKHTDIEVFFIRFMLSSVIVFDRNHLHRRILMYYQHSVCLNGSYMQSWRPTNAHPGQTPASPPPRPTPLGRKAVLFCTRGHFRELLAVITWKEVL